MTSESFGCRDISRRRWGGSAGWEGCCFGLSEGVAPVTLVAAGVVWMYCTRVGCYWTRVGGTGGRWGLRAVRITRPDPRGAGRLGPTRGRGRSRTMTTGTQRRRRSGDGGGGSVTEAPGYTSRTPDSLLHGPVSTALTSTSPPPKLSTGIVGILGFFFGAQRRRGVDVSTMDTSDLPDLFPSISPSSPGSPACPGFPSERVSQQS